MLDYQAVREEKISFADLVTGLTKDDLHQQSEVLVQTILDLISGCVDADVVFIPADPKAHDPYAATAEEVDMAWTLSHVIVHTTASAEESAAVAAELARGVRYHGRSRYETPWEKVKNIAQCLQRLEESRHMRLASLEMWPEDPHLENGYRLWKNEPKVNAIGRFVLGLMHEEEHLEQIGDIVRQAKAARQESRS